MLSHSGKAQLQPSVSIEHRHLSENLRKTINDASRATTITYRIVYLKTYDNVSTARQSSNNQFLLTIHRLWRFCLVENSGGRICFEGRSQTVIVSATMKIKRGRGLTKHSRMQPVEERDQGGWCQDDQEDVAE